MHAEAMADAGRYLTLRDVAVTLATEAMNHFACLRKGHDPLLCNGVTFCRRCFRRLRR